MKSSKFLTAICLLVTALAVGSCTQDEGMNGNGTPLPEGKYPLMLTATQNAVVASLQTRVSDYEEAGSQKSKWTTGDQIKVVVSEGNNDMETVCTLNENGNITNYNPQLYWKTTQSSKINAWYSNITGQSTTTSSTVSLADQSSRLAYVLKADELTGKNYQSGSLPLVFTHQLAKVRVKLKRGTYVGDLTGATVKVKGYTSCTVSNGSVTGTTEDYISTLKNGDYFEANLVPQNVSATNFIKIIDNTNKEIAVALTAGATLVKGQVHTFTITVNKLGPLHVKLSEINTDTYTFDRDGTLEGDNETYKKSIYIADGVTLTIKNVKLKAATNKHAIYGQGTAILILEDTNTADGTSEYAAGVAAKTSITIKGTGSLEATGGTHAPGVGGGLYSFESSGECGDIIIESGTISSTANWAGYYPTGLGNHCGSITITGGNVTATTSSDNVACIGPGLNSICKDITISGGTITTQKKGNNNKSIETNGGTITISAGVIVNGITYSTEHTGEVL